MDHYDMDDDVVAPPSEHDGSSPLKEWRLKHQAGTLTRNDFVEYFKNESPKYFEFQNETETDYRASAVKCIYKEALAKEEIIDLVGEFMLGDNPHRVLEKLRLEGNTATVCGKVFKNGEPTYSCRECGVDPTCVLCVNCFKRSEHRFHKYKMSTSGGGGCCDCGDDEAWKGSQYCELHLANRKDPMDSQILTAEVLERVEICFAAILQFCVNYLEMEPNASLQGLDGEVDGPNFCTVLYNDESHTFDQVIQTLTKIVNCRDKDAMEIVAAIDREGRAVVKCDTFKVCNDLKTAIENQTTGLVSTARQNQSLRTSVLHINSVAGQQFALQLLSWFQEFLVKHCLFRKTFGTLVQQKNEMFSIRHILEYDVKLWKTARTCWHRLLISGMLMEYANKMVLAQEFSRRYATIIQDFISDDHDHCFSIVSLSVQLFTVPSIAHHLIAIEGIFDKLLHTFYHVAIEVFISNRTLHFSKNTTSMAHFKRANYILYDLRYLLSLKPEVMSTELRSGFLDGCKALMRVLNVMQGMESITRQMGQHMDYEPEWECAFNLHIKLASTISQVIEWASSDEYLLRKLYKMTVRALVNNNFIVGNEKVEPKTVAGHEAQCLIYDVSASPVSIHLPLSRFYAAIYLHLDTYNLTYDGLQSEVESLNLSMKLTPREIIEPVLCTQAMMAQVAAGMWRRNGYSLLHQLYFYRNVRCRVEMLDRDIVCLQIGASLMESNEFLIHMLNKFNMIELMQPNYKRELPQPNDETHQRQLSMTDEFLELLIVIIGERWMPGVSMVSEEDRLRKEIIQLLCIKSHSHSELSRALPDSNNGNNDVIIEEVINSVAVFRKPAGVDSKGVYELKEHLYDEFNVYFYHYTKEDKSKAEESERARRKHKKQLVCCPPPMLPKLTPPFTSMANILQCNIFLSITTLVMDRALDPISRFFTESHLQKVLHLLGFAIQEELSENYPFLSFYESSQKYRVLEKLEELARLPRLEAHHDFLLWTIKRYKELQAKQPTPTTSTGAAAAGGDQQEVEKMSDDEPQPVTIEEQARIDKEARARMAAEARAKIMAQMKNAQTSFMKSNAELFAITVESESSTSINPNTNTGTVEASGGTAASSGAGGNSMDWEFIVESAEEQEGAAALMPDPKNQISCLGPNRLYSEPQETQMKCILCFEPCVISSSGPPVVSPAFVQTSRVLYTMRTEKGALKPGMHASCCGHMMHFDCWREYFSAEEHRDSRRPQRNRSLFSPVNAIEFQCSYCRTLSNTILPVIEPLSKLSSPPTAPTAGSTSGAQGGNLQQLPAYIEKLRGLFHDVMRNQSSESMEQLERRVQIWNLAPKHTDWKELMVFLSKSLNNVMLNQTAGQKLPSDETNAPPDSMSMLLDTCSYTLQALEVYLYATKKSLRDELPMRHQSCINNLVRCCALASVDMYFDLRKRREKAIELVNIVFCQSGSSVLEWDCFRMLVQLEFTVPLLLAFSEENETIVPSGGRFDYYMLQTMFLANLTKAVICFDYDKELPRISGAALAPMLQYVEQLPVKRQLEMATFYCTYNMAAIRRENDEADKYANFETIEDDSSEVRQEMQLPKNCTQTHLALLLLYLEQQMSSFLRCACLFYRCITDVDFPDTFPIDQPDRCDLMCQYLGLESHLSNYFDSQTAYASIMSEFGRFAHKQEYVLKACGNPLLQPSTSTNADTTESGIELVPCLRPLPRLVTLYDDYSDLFNSVSDIICPNNEREEMKTPTMCLICGTILCGQSYCCQPELGKNRVGACTHHALTCGAEVGIFLRIRDCQVVYLGRGKGCLVLPPYLDEYGETDQNLRRGNPLRLCKAAYERIYLQWLGHNLHKEIARLNESVNVPVPVTQWHHM